MKRLHPLFLGVVIVAAGLIFMAAGPSAAESPNDRYHPAIAGHGRIVPLPNATLPPEAGHRVIFDITKAAGDPSEVNPGLDRVARYLNLLASANVKPRQAPVVVVLHGDATEAVLDDAAYHVRHDRQNPNLELARLLAEHGVKLYVCGQALAGINVDPGQTSEPFEVASSAMSVLAAFQSRQYALLPQY